MVFACLVYIVQLKFCRTAATLVHRCVLFVQLQFFVITELFVHRCTVFLYSSRSPCEASPCVNAGFFDVAIFVYSSILAVR